MPEAPRLLERVRHAIRLRHYSFATERIYVHWIKRFILANNKRHPRDMGAPRGRSVLDDVGGKGECLALDSKPGPVSSSVSLPSCSRD